MKKSNLIITIAIALVLSVSSVGAILATSGVFAASDSYVQSTAGAIQFDAPSGIRWNAGKNAFEVFNYAGVTHVASGWYANATGDVLQTTSDPNYYQMTGRKTYYIMQDIFYEDTAAINATCKDTVPHFGDADIENGGGDGVLDGRGHTLYNFTSRGESMLFATVYGKIQNLTISNDLSVPISAISYFGGTFAKNLYGSIINCVASVTIISGSSQVGGIVGNCGDGGLILNCDSYGDIKMSNGGTGTTTASGGICGNLGNAQIINCRNFGTIFGMRKVGGVVGSNSNGFGTIVGCENYGDVKSASVELALLAGVAAKIHTSTTTAVGCINYGKIGSDALLHQCGGIFGQVLNVSNSSRGNINHGIAIGATIIE